MANNNVYMKFYFGDYLKDTQGMSATEHGVYFLLIMEYWTHGGLPKNKQKIYRIAQGFDAKTKRIVDDILNQFFIKN